MQGRVARWCRALLAASLVSPVAVVLAGPAWLAFEAVSARSARAAEPAQATAPELRVELGAHAGPVRGVTITADGRRLITVSDDKTARVWQLEGSVAGGQEGRLLHVLRPAVGGDDVGTVYGVAAHPFEDLVAVGGRTSASQGPHRILLYRPSTGVFVRAFDARAGDVTRLQWSPDGRLLFAVYRGDNAFRAFDRDGRLVFEDRFGGPAYGLAVSAQGQVAVSAYDGQVRRYAIDGATLKRGEVIRTGAAPRGLAFSPDGRQLAIGTLAVDSGSGAPTVHDASTGAVLARMPRPTLAAGNLANVQFSADGQTLYAAGTGYSRIGSHPIIAYRWAGAAITGEVEASTNSITDLVLARDGAVVFAGFDSRWGKLTPSGQVLTAGRLLVDRRDPRELLASPDGRRVSMYSRLDRRWFDFDLDRRLVGSAGPGQGLQRPRLEGGERGDLWENTRTPRVNGRSVEMQADELARAIAFAADGRTAALGSSRRLLRIASDGRVAWTQRVPSEVQALHLAADGRIVIAAHADGTVRWWRFDDGALLMTLLLLTDGRWIAWTPGGYFDAGPGADRMAGWAVNRAGEPVADFVSLGRFRERYQRPAVLDRILSALDERKALTEVETLAAATSVTPAPAPTPTPRPVPTLPTAPTAEATPAIPLALPPILVTAAGARFDDDKALRIPFSARAGPDTRYEVRVDGRPAPAARVDVVPPGAGLPAAGEVVVSSPLPTGATVQLIARDQNGVSEPLGVAIASPVSVEPLLAVPQAPTLEARTPAAAAGRITLLSPTPPGFAGPGPGIAPSPGGPTALSARPRLAVLSIGIGAYRDASIRLSLPAKDARDFASALKLQRGRLYGEVDSIVLTDQDATRARIEQELERLVAKVGPDDLAFVFLAGHGVSTTAGNYFFLPWESEPDTVRSTGLPESTIRSALSRIRGKVLLFVDTCHAGSAIGSFVTANRDLARLGNDLASSENGIVVFASSTGRQLSEENDAWGNGAFTRAVVDGLSGKADLQKSGRVTFKALDLYVSDAVSRLTEGRQTPVTISPIGVPDFAVARSDNI